MPRTLCAICDSDDFDNIDGFYYCNVCGTKSEGRVDIELSDEDDRHIGLGELAKQKVSKKIAKDDETQDDISNQYSTYHVFTHLLKAQSFDLIKLGVNPLIEQIVFRLWAKYLQKLKIAFIDDKEKINKKNLKSQRDKKYFEIYELKLEYEKNEKENDQVSSSFNNEVNRLNNINLNDDNEYTKQLSDEEKEIEQEFEEENEIWDDEEGIKTTILLTKFESLRMPHTIAILHLGLLMIKSHVLLTDLIRYIYNGKVSYFNINQVLPESFNFTLADDHRLFNIISVPNNDYMNYLTAKLAKFLDIGTIEIVPIKEVISRYLIDLNLPFELHESVSWLVMKSKPPCELEFDKAKYENIEAVALSYIYATILILFFYDNKIGLNKSNNSTNIYFNFDDWLSVMQSSFDNIHINIFGKKLTNVRNIQDLETLKLKHINHRRKIKNTKKYYSQYRLDDIKQKLQAPLNENGDEMDIGTDSEQEFRNSSIFYITNPNWMKIKNLKEKKIECYLNEDKIKLLSETNYKSNRFRMFYKEKFQSNQDRGHYLIGLSATNLDYLLDKFSQISQTSFNQMFNYVKKLMNKLKF